MTITKWGFLALSLGFAQMPVQVAIAQSSPDALVGQWQGTLHVNRDLRAVIKIAKTDSGGLTGTMYSIDQSSDGRPITVILDGSTVTMSIGFQGTLSADGQTIKGNVTQGIAVPFELVRATEQTAWPIPEAKDTSTHTVQFVQVDKDVKLEVLDWGGSGRPLIFLAGLGATAHTFDGFVPNFTGAWHVYGITRRGYGASSKPDPSGENYSADRLGDDVLAVIDALKLDRPALVGHSLAGEELSSVASRHPDKIAAVIYIEAAHAYGFYAPGNVNPAGVNLTIDANDLRARVESLSASRGKPQQATALVDDLLKTSLPQLEIDLKAAQKQILEIPAPPSAPPPPLERSPQARIDNAVTMGVRKYTKLNVPVLAIFAVPGARPVTAPPAMRSLQKLLDEWNTETANRFEAANPAAWVVRIANSRHDVYNSNTQEVVGAMKGFLATVK